MDKEEEQDCSRKSLRRIGIMGEESKTGLKTITWINRLSRMKHIARNYG